MENTIDKLFKDFDYQKFQKEIRAENNGSMEFDMGKPVGKEFGSDLKTNQSKKDQKKNRLIKPV